MKILVTNVYKKYGVILFKAAEQLKLFPENKDKTLRIVPQCSTN